MKRTIAVCLGLLTACSPSTPKKDKLFQQRAYLWQRDWNDAVAESVLEAEQRMDGIVVLGAEIEFTDKEPNVARANINWNLLKSNQINYAAVLRIAPYQGPFVADDSATRVVVSTARELVELARKDRVSLTEIQLDFDCTTKNLAGYRIWVEAVRQAIRPVRLVITTLPAWLDDPEFAPLVRAADGYVLQVHSVPVTRSETTDLCDTASARAWVAKADQLGLPFSVALPTYRCSAGYDEEGKLVGVAMDSAEPAWPPDTQVLQFTTNPDQVAMLVSEWLVKRPPQLREIIWFRLPVKTDTRNWQWTTLSVVMTGRKPVHRVEIRQEGENPVDLSVVNGGEADEPVRVQVTASWGAGELVAGEALPGWSADLGPRRAVFTPDLAHLIYLPPGAKREIGRLRFEQPVKLQIALTTKSDVPR